MEERLLDEEFLRQRSNDLQLSFEQVLAASILEEIILRLSESEYADSFWLKNTNRLNLKSYQQKVNLNPELFLKESKKLHYKKQEISNICSELFKKNNKDAIHWNYNLREQNSVIHVNITATFEAVKVPVKVKINHLENVQLKPDKRELECTIYNRKIFVSCFPSIELMTVRFIEIMQKLELVNDLSLYDDIYNILKSETVSGRHIWELLNEGCRKNGIPIDEERFGMLLSYRTSRYMMKKWKAYLRHEKKSEPSWDEVMHVIEIFFGTIWSNLCMNVVYLGDWMPELGRFID